MVMNSPSRPSNELSAAVLDAMAASIAVLDASGRILQTNVAWDRFALANGARDPASWVGQDYLAVCEAALPADDPTPRLAATGIRSVLLGQREEYTLDYPCHAPDMPRWFQLRVRRIRVPAGDAHCVVAHEDITARVLSEQRLVQARETDPQTGLANWRHFQHRWSLAWERLRHGGPPLALMEIEVLPGEAGEAAPGRLRPLADALRALASSPGCCAARGAGDRLLLLATPAEVDRVAARLDAWGRTAGAAQPGLRWQVRISAVDGADGIDPLPALARLVEVPT